MKRRKYPHKKANRHFLEIAIMLGWWNWFVPVIPVCYDAERPVLSAFPNPDARLLSPRV